MPWVFTPITVRSAWLPGRTGSAEPALSVKIVVPARLIEQALSRVKQVKRRGTSRGQLPKHRKEAAERKALPPPLSEEDSDALFDDRD